MQMQYVTAFCSRLKAMAIYIQICLPINKAWFVIDTLGFLAFAGWLVSVYCLTALFDNEGH